MARRGAHAKEGEGTLCQSRHLYLASGPWQKRDVPPAVKSQQVRVTRVKLETGRGMNQNPNHAPDAVLTCGESVAVIQIGTESVDRRAGRGQNWHMDSLPKGEEKVRAYQLVLFEVAAKIHW